ncbi:unnamed protein product [Miscanthus lutarioriparius]|uniref:Fungal lipase-like domain-containing protein n=1 Tax=Miscanthus lutarioriparius TaxID=422564 RepID=A0A811N3Y2_9POAL|nr:unnamed protein product [Miscanthus lutarioriparius]
MESDEYMNRTHTGEALAPAWWESFNFRRLKTLRYECECLLCETKTRLSSSFGAHRPCSIYGAILEHVPPAGGALRHPSAPRYIVAFRGTILRRHQHQPHQHEQQQQHTVFGDMHLNLRILANKQHGCDRFRDARKEVGRLLDSVADGSHVAPAAVWLVGHSLGASIALNVGRDMAAKGCYLPTFLFNPPQGRQEGRVPDELRCEGGAGVDGAEATGEGHGAALFQTLAPWVPELYVHERDIVCQGFIDYFEQRQKMLDRLRPVAEVAMKLSLRDMLISFHSTDPAESGEDQRVRPHLLPSARLWKNSSYHYAHGLEQWWKPDNELRLSSRRYSDRGAEAELLYG